MPSPVGGAALRAAARTAAGPAGRAFVVTGGAFPTGVRGDGETAAALSDTLSPPSYRGDLTAPMRATA